MNIKDKILLKNSLNKKQYYLENKKKILKQRKLYSLKNRQKLIEYLKEYRTKNKQIIKEKKRLNYINNSKSIKQKVSDYYQNNKEKCNERKKIRNKVRRKIDINFKIKSNLRRRVHHVLNGLSKSKSTLKLLGCSIEFLKEHLEYNFSKGMSWNNYGLNGWVIDHIIPCATFNLLKISEQKICFHWSNLQPLWEIDNLHKHSKY